MRKTGFLFVILMFSVIAQTRADDKVHLDYDTKTQIRLPAPVKIKKAIDALTLLSDDGQIYSLTGLDIPADNDTAPKAQSRIAQLAEKKGCTLYQTRSEKVGRVNRLNQILGHFTCGKDDIWLQGTLLNEGLARVRTTPENRDLATKMLILEASARAKKLGLWALPMNTPLTPATAPDHINSFAIVEGTIYTTAQNRDAIFLNFTSDWKTDFSIGIPAKLRRDFSKVRIDPMSLKGQSVRVRGWMRDYNGPYIELDHVDQLELIADKKAPAPSAAQRLQDGLEDILGGDQPATTVPHEKQFMHTIGGPTAPKIEKPTIKKPDVDKPDAPVIPKDIGKQYN